HRRVPGRAAATGAGAALDHPARHREPAARADGRRRGPSGRGGDPGGDARCAGVDPREQGADDRERDADRSDRGHADDGRIAGRCSALPPSATRRHPPHTKARPDMAVLVEAITVVVRCSTLDEKYPGGAAEYQVDAPNRTFCTDGELTAFAFMHPDDVGSHIERLRQEGIRFMNDDGSSDEIAVVDRTVGPTTP